MKIIRSAGHVFATIGRGVAFVIISVVKAVDGMSGRHATTDEQVIGLYSQKDEYRP